MLNPKEKAALDLIKSDKAYENYFFNKVKKLKWFYPLKEESYFNPENAPLPEETNKDGYYRIPEWNILSYLERISSMNNHAKYDQFIDEILEIIINVSTYKNNEGKHIENYRIWWYFTKILANIPNEKIKLEIIELIPIWLNSKFDNTLVSSEIADKLIPKFLSENANKNDIEIAEKIIDNITKFKKLNMEEPDKKHYLNEKKYKLLVDAHQFKKIIKDYSINIAKKCTNNLILKLKKRIKLLLNRKEVKIDFKINSKEYYLNAKSITDSNNEIILSNVDNITLSKITTKINISKNKFIEKIYNEIFKKSLKNIKDEKYFKNQIYILYNNLYSYGTYHSFYAEKEYPETNTLDLLTLFLKKILTYKAKEDIAGTKKILNEFLKDKYYYFKKMSVYIIGQNIKNYEKLYWNILDSEIGEIITKEIYFADELKHLFENTKDIPNDKKEKLEEIIESGPDIANIPAEEQERYIKVWKQKRYEALKSDEYFKNKYESLKKDTKSEVKLSPGIGEVKVEWDSDESPLKQEEIMQMSNDELVNFILEFKPTNNWKEPTHNGLARNLESIAKKEPNKFVKNLNPFLSIGYIYIYHIISGLTGAWKEKKPINWGKVFDFIEKYLNRDGFWNNKFIVSGDEWNFNSLSVIGQIGLLIQEGTQNDNWAFESKYIDKSIGLLFNSIDNLTEEDTYIDEPVTKTLNTAFGKIIEALINTSLRIARTKDGANSNNKWRSDLKAKYEELFEKEINEAYTLFGLYMANFYYLDSQWTKNHINDFESIESELWSSFMTGYLFDSKIKAELYNLMINNYTKALSYPLTKNTKSRVVQHITFSYLFNEENKRENLFSRLLDEWDTDNILDIISFLWSNEEYLVNENESEIRNKILAFWKKIYNKYENKDNLSDDDKIIISSVIKLMVFLTKLDDEKSNWIKLSAPYIQLEYNEPIFIKQLVRLRNEDKSIKTLRHIGEILLLAPVTRYNLEKIISIIKDFFEAKDQKLIELARKICDKYSKAGNLQVKKVYDKYI